jgi:hypothetical protein
LNIVASSLADVSLTVEDEPQHAAITGSSVPGERVGSRVSVGVLMASAYRSGGDISTNVEEVL